MLRFLSFILLGLAPCIALASSPERLFTLIDARLLLMHEVAAYKWRHHLPIEDKAREKIVLDSATAAALRHGLRQRPAWDFFNAQIAAAKEIEHYWFRQFRAGANPGPAPDLRKSIRPRLMVLGIEITAALADLPHGVSPLWWDAFIQRVHARGLPASSRLAIFNALTHISHYANRLQQILDTRELRVGTTGDYAPFSVERNGRYTGIDIDMARNLAAALGVKLVLVHTTWPHLMRDLRAGRYDIAMGGVSRNTARERYGYFSTPYYHGGKAAIARCSDAAKYTSLAAIDRPGVRVIVNPGGTNAAFVRRNIKRAKVITFSNNRKIFDQIIDHKADVMITDSIEVKLQAARHKSLCDTMPGKTLTYLDKAYLMPQDNALKAYVDNWLDLRRKDGTVARIFANYVN